MQSQIVSVFSLLPLGWWNHIVQGAQVLYVQYGEEEITNLETFARKFCGYVIWMENKYLLCLNHEAPGAY